MPKEIWATTGTSYENSTDQHSDEHQANMDTIEKELTYNQQGLP